MGSYADRFGMTPAQWTVATPTLASSAATKSYVDATTNHIFGITLILTVFDTSANIHTLAFTNGILQGHSVVGP